MSGASPPGSDRFGPWAVRCCVTAACTRCGAIPIDARTGRTPHYDSLDHARWELSLIRGWRVTTRSARAHDDELLCPACATAADAGNPAAPAPDPDGDQQPDAPPWWEDPAQPRPALPPNAAVIPVPRTPPEG